MRLHKRIYRTVGTGGSFGSNCYRVEIGLRDYHGTINVQVKWPRSGNEQLFTDLAPNAFYLLKENEDHAEVLERSSFHMTRKAHSHEHHH